MRQKLKNKFFISILILIGISVSLSSKPKNEWEINNTLNERQINNMACLAKIYGYTRYFYPNLLVEKDFDSLNWYRFLIMASDDIVSSENDSELKENLNKYFNPIISELTFDYSEESPINKSEYLNKYYAWRHNGTGIRPYKNIFESVITEFNAINDTVPVPDSLYHFPLNNNITAYFPLAISYRHESESERYRELKKSIKQIKFKLLTENYFKLLFGKGKKEFAFLQDYRFRAADIIVKWNIIQHFYPYFEEDNLNQKWEEVLKISIKNAAECRNQFEYYDVVTEMLAHVNDSHISINTTSYLGGLVAAYLPYYIPPIELDWCQDKIYIRNPPTHLEDKISKGDYISSVNDIPIDILIESKWNQVSASTRQGKYESLLRERLFGSFVKDSVLRITFGGQNSEQYTVDFQTNYTDYNLTIEDYPYFIKNLGNDIFHINLTHHGEDASYNIFKDYIDKLKESKGIILDIRGYPDYNITDSIITHFYPDSIRWGDFGLPTYYYPDHMNVLYQRDVEYLPKTSNYIATPLCILINHKAMSYAETVIEIFKRHKIGTLIGEPTIGTNGDVGMIILPVYGFNMTVIKDLSGNHGKGIEPDIKVKQTLESVRNNEDLILKKAIGFLLEEE